MATKLYLHATTSGLPSGTLPSAEQSTLTANDNFEANQATNRLMNTTIGTSHTTLSNSSIASTSIQNYYIARWVSPVIYQTSVAANTWTLNFAAQQSNNSANFPVSGTFQPIHVNCYVWKPSNGTNYGTILDGNTGNAYHENTSLIAEHGTFTGAAVSSLTSGDACIVIEMWARVTQAHASSYTQTIAFDGTVENTSTAGPAVSDHASFLETPENLSFTPAGNNITRALPTETVSVSESVSITRNKIRTRSETVIVSESATRQTAKYRALAAESVSISESVTRVKGKVKSLPTETVAVSESLANPLRNKIRSINENVGVSESATRQTAKNRALATESVSISESVTKVKGIPRALATETVSIGESLTRLASKIRALVTETVAISESATRQAAKSRSLATETVAVSESVTQLKARQVNRALPTETVAVSESLTRVKGVNRALSTETVSISESVSRLLAKSRSRLESVSIGESLSRQSNKIRALATETVSISESVSRVVTHGGQNITRALAVEIVAIGESIARQTNKTRAIIEGVSISESLARQANKARTIPTESVAISESLTRIKSKTRSLPAESVPISESLGITKGKIRSLLEIVPVSESVSVLATAIVVIVDKVTHVVTGIPKRFVHKTEVVNRDELERGFFKLRRDITKSKWLQGFKI